MLPDPDPILGRLPDPANNPLPVTLNPWFCCPLLKISSGNPYQNILEIAQLFVADAPMKKKSIKSCFPPSQRHFKYRSENRPWVRGLKEPKYHSSVGNNRCFVENKNKLCIDTFQKN